MTAEGEAGVFTSCRFCLSPASSEDGSLVTLIEANGGRVDNYLTDMSTHVIVEDNEGESDLISEARDLYEKPVVTPRWVRLCIQAKHLLTLDGFNPQNRLFHGKVFCFSKLEKSDLRSLWAMITFNGGRIQLSMDSKCSHLVTTSIVGNKYSKANGVDSIEIVTPDWISDCVSRKELICCEAYHPSLLITSKEPSPPLPAEPTPPPAEIKIEPSTTPLPTTPTTPQPPSVLNSRPDSVSSMGPTPPPPPQLSSPVQQQNMVGPPPMQSPQPGPPSSGPNMQGQLAQMLTGGQRMSVPNGPPMSQGQQMVMVSGKTVGGQQVVMQGQRMMFQQQQQQQPQQQMPPQQSPLQQQQQQQPPLSPSPQMHQQQQQPPQQQQQHQIPQQNPQGPPQMVRQQWVGPQGQQLTPQQMQMLRQQRHRMVLAPGSNGQRLVVAIPEQLQQMRLRAPMGQPGGQTMGPQGQMMSQAGGQGMMGPQGGQGVPQPSGQMSPMAQPIRNQNQGMLPQASQQMMMSPQHQQAQQSQMRPMGPPAPGKPMQRPQQGPPSQQQQLQQGGVNPAWRFQQNQMSGPTSPVVSPQGPPPMQWQQHDPMMQQRVQQDPHYQQRVEMQRRQMMQQQQSPGLTPAQPPVAPASSPTSGDSQTPPSLQANSAVQQQQPQQQPSQQPTPPSQSGQAPSPVAPPSQSMAGPPGHMISPVGISSRVPPHTVAQSPQLQVPANAANPAQINPPPPGRVGVLLATTHSSNLPQNAQIVNGQMRSMQNISVHQSPLGPQILRSPSPQPQQASGNTVHKMAPQIVQGPMAQNGQRMMVPQQMRIPMQNQQRMPMGPGQVQQIPQQRFVGPMGQPIIQGPPPPGVKVNPQTKTALANLLNNRLGGSQQGEMGMPPGPMQQQGSMGAPIQGVMRYQTVSVDGAVQQQGQQAPPNQALQPQAVAYRPPGPPVRAVRPEFFSSAPQEALVGHEASANVTADVVFIGCTFFFTFSHSQEFTKEQLRIARGVCIEKGGVVVDTYDAQVTHVVCEHQGQQFVEQAVVEGKRVVTLYWINDVVLEGKMVPPWQALHLPTAYGPREMPCQQHVIATTGFIGEERLRIRTMIRKVGAKYSPFMSRENSLLIVKSIRWNEKGEKYRRAQEWNMTCVNALWLHDVMLGHNEAIRMPVAPKYQVSDTEVPATRIDFGIAQPLLVAWKAPIRVTDDHWKSFSESEVSKKIQKRKKELAEREANKKKRTTNDENCVTVTNPNPPSEGQRPVVMFSGINDPEPLKRKILQLGGQIAKSAKDATHLVLPKFCRTIKVMCAVNYVKHICSPDWVHECHKANTFLDPSEYWLQDSEAEHQFGFNLRYIYAQRQRGAAPALKGCVFYVTPGCLPTIPVLKDIVESAGGSMYLNKRPTIKYINQINENPQSRFFCVTCEDDLYMCKELIDNQIPLYNVELILTSILRQKVEPEEYLLDCCV